MDIKQILNGQVEFFRYAPMKDRGEEVFALIEVDGKVDDWEKLAKFVWQASLDEYHRYKNDSLMAVKRMVRSGLKCMSTFIRQGSLHPSSNDNSGGGVTNVGTEGQSTSFKGTVDIHLLFLIKRGLNVYFMLVGDQKFYIRRGNEVLSVSEHLKKHNINYGSTVLKDTDILLFAGSKYEYAAKDKVFEAGFSGLSDSIKESGNLVICSLNNVKPDLLESDKDSVEDVLSGKNGDSNEMDNKIERVDAVADTKTSVTTVTAVEKIDDQVSNQPNDGTDVDSTHKVITSKINIKEAEDNHEADILSTGSISKVEKSVFKKIYVRLPKKLQLKIVGFVRSPFGSKVVFIVKKLFIILLQVCTKVSKVLGVVFKTITVWLSKLGRKIGQQLQSKYGRKLWYKRWLAKLSRLRMSTYGMKGTRIDVTRLKNQNMGNHRKVIMVVIAIVLLFIGFRWIQQKRIEFGVHMQVVEKMELVKTRLDEAERLANTDKTKARQKYGEALELLNSTKKIAMITEDENAVNKLYDRLKDLNVDINNVVIVSEEIGNIEVFLDGKLSFGDSSDLSDIDIRRDQYMNELLFISDRGMGAVYRVSLYNKSVVMVDDDSAVLTKPEYLSIGNSGLYVYENDSGMYKSSFDSNGKNTSWKPLPALGVDSVGKREVSDLAIFTENDNVYLLEQDNGKMLKSYSFENGGYGLPVTYLEDADGENVLANSTDLLGDYFYVYILSEASNGIYRYISEQGTGLKLDAIEVLGVYPAIQNVQAGFTGPSMNDDFYVFDKGMGNYDGGGRILRFEKPNVDKHRHIGQFVLVKQYVYCGQKDGVFDDVQDIVVDAAQKYMYVVDGVKVWKIEL